MLNEEGGIDPLEFRFYAMTDRVATTATVWLGLTMGCAQCHTHKFDPIPHREYYRFMALLDNAEEPEIEVPSPDVARRRREIEAKNRRADRRTFRTGSRSESDPGDKRLGREMERRKANREARFREWLARRGAPRPCAGRPLTPVKASSNLPHLSIEPDGSVFVSGDQSKRDLYRLEFRSGLRGITAIRLEVLPDERLPNHGPGRVFYEGAAGRFLPERGPREGRREAGTTGQPRRRAGPKASSAPVAIDGDPQTGWSINGGQGQAHSAVFRLGTTLPKAR